jgi:hypothetical protein
MARAVTKCVFAALLALLSTQAVTSSMRVAAAIEIVCGSRAVQEVPRKGRRIRTDAQVRQAAPTYVSRTKPEPDTAALFQRPPPQISFFS